MDWVAVYEACQLVGGTEWVTAEQETYPDGRSSMDCTRESLDGFHRMVAGPSRGY